MIIHIDMDAFYASVEIRDNPKLRGQPVIVGAAENRGVVSAASYEARKFGVHSAMPSSKAKQLCPHAVFLPVRMSHYAAISQQIREIFHRFTPLVEPLSLDEAFLDASGSEKLFGTSEAIARQIKEQISSELNLVASAGVAPNKFLAKIASDLNKPDGFVLVPEGGEQDFLDPLPIKRIWGIGNKGQEKFHRLGITTVKQLRSVSLSDMSTHFGKLGEHCWRLANCLDDRLVVPDRNAKSISHETTFREDIVEPELLRSVIVQLCDQVARRLRRNDIVGATLQMKLRFSDFRTISRAQKLDPPTNVTEDIRQAAIEVFDRALPEPTPIRLIGVGVSHLQSANAKRQKSLFDESEHERQSKLDAVRDDIQNQFGSAGIKRGSSMLGRRGKSDNG